MVLNQKVGKSKHLKGQLGTLVRDEMVYVTKNEHFLKPSQEHASYHIFLMRDYNAGQVLSKLSAGGKKRDVENTRRNCILARQTSLGPPPAHPAPGCANFGRDFFRGSVFVIMTILRGTILAQGHHHFPNSH